MWIDFLYKTIVKNIVKLKRLSFKIESCIILVSNLAEWYNIFFNYT